MTKGVLGNGVCRVNMTTGINSRPLAMTPTTIAPTTDGYFYYDGMEVIQRRPAHGFQKSVLSAAQKGFEMEWKEAVPKNRRAFVSNWDEIVYLCGKIEYWFYEKNSRARCGPFSVRLKALVDKFGPSARAIIVWKCRALLHDLEGKVSQEIKCRKKEVELRFELQKELSKGRSRILKKMKMRELDELLYAMAFLAVAHHDNNDLESAIDTLLACKKLCARHRRKFDSQRYLAQLQRESNFLAASDVGRLR